jgi:hypothetical protein
MREQQGVFAEESKESRAAAAFSTGSELRAAQKAPVPPPPKPPPEKPPPPPKPEPPELERGAEAKVCPAVVAMCDIELEK